MHANEVNRRSWPSCFFIDSAGVPMARNIKFPKVVGAATIEQLKSLLAEGHTWHRIIKSNMI